ncbi:sensor histidine kinase [Bizionia saleffrena]|uniref:histidine kinase n=1 Tax=Bizionia saleffrena TaxID=291189 RepID=A0A8H2QF93_9FLAO|nr:tetratricopeptide repeat-containing sensor histidine kinase [Bizionia saleffrena]TYB74400.1 sensor histidine kinase [Bizionia saleffrena]
MKHLFVLFLALVSLNCFSQTEELDNLAIQLAYESSESSKVAISIEIIKNLIALKDFDKALKHIKQSEKLSKKLNSDKKLAQLLYYKALILSLKDDYITSVNLLNKSKALSIKLNDSLFTAEINSKLGAIQIEHGDYKQGIINIKKGIIQLESKNDSPTLSEAYNTLASAYKNINQFENSQKFYLKNIEINKNLGNREAILQTHIDLAELYIEHKHYKEAVFNFENALTLLDTKNEEYKGRIQPQLGTAYINFKNLDLANRHLIEGLEINRRLKNTEGTIHSLNGLAELNRIKRRFKTAKKLALEAKTLGESINDKQKLLYSYRLLKDLDSLQGNFKQAYLWQSKYFTIKNRLDREKEKKEQLARTLDAITIENDDLKVSTLSKIKVSTVANTQANTPFKLAFYVLIIVFAIALLFLISISIKRNGLLKDIRRLETKNRDIELENKSILEQKEHLESINDIKDKLFSIVSHDLKDSLISTKEFIDLLKDGSISQDEFRSLLPELSDNANNASLLLFNLLNWSKSQMQTLVSNPSLFDIQEVFYEKIKLIDLKLQSKNIQLVDKTVKDVVYADRSMVEIIIQNLLANAVKFCKSGDIITLSNHISNGYALITVADSGIGITEENQRQLFSKNSISTIGTNNEKGTGLGLSICKDLVELNNGRIWVDSTINKGSSFYIELPKDKVKTPELV